LREDAEQVVRRISQPQGWTESTQRILLMEFINEVGMVQKLEDYLTRLVVAEKAMSENWAEAQHS
jgi:hypothetical protein